jgi:hypothetical protein
LRFWESEYLVIVATAADVNLKNAMVLDQMVQNLKELILRDRDELS